MSVFAYITLPLSQKLRRDVRARFETVFALGYVIKGVIFHLSCSIIIINY